jgi:large subunit ribosomal protein L29
MAKASDYRELKPEELVDRLSDARQELFKARFDHATGQLSNSARLGQVRKDIARLETLIRQNELASIDEGEK